MAMILPKVVTFTGPDDSVLAKDIKRVAKKYPDTEWGILFGANDRGSSRYPSRLWLETELPKLKGLNLTAHLCGRWVYDLVLRGDFTWIYAYDSISKLFQRVQLNFHGQQFPPAPPSFLPRIQDAPYQFIFQNDEVNGHLMGSVGAEKRVRLFDVSHGAGVLPSVTGTADGTSSWPKRTMYEYMGYAGGLGPNNIKEQLALIEKAANPQAFGPYWIDMESRVRTQDSFGDRFDLKKVRQVCQSVWGD